MSYKQLITPNINIGATPGWCLKYVDDAVNAPQRNSTAQIAHDVAKSKGWVQTNTDFPKNVWFVLFWAITAGPYAGQGHVALAFVNSNGGMQIHDSEVHSGSRGVYSSISEINNWFSNSGFVYLGWSIGVDGAQLIVGDNDSNGGNDTGKTEIGENEMILYKVTDNVSKMNGSIWLFNGEQLTRLDGTSATKLGKNIKTIDINQAEISSLKNIGIRTVGDFKY